MRRFQPPGFRLRARSSRHPGRLFACAALFVLTCALGRLPTRAADAGAAATPVARPLRAASAVLADYAQALGGAQSWERHRSVLLRREIEAVGMQIRGTEERRATRDGRVMSVTSLPGMGSFRQGGDGKVRWSEDPINGLRILAGAEDEQARIESTWAGDFRLEKLYRTTRSVPPPAGDPAARGDECVELSPALGRAVTACFDARTHLRTSQRGVHTTPQGDVPYEVVFADWRRVKGVMLPFAETMTAGPISLRAQLLEVVFDEKHPASLYTMPHPPKTAK